MSDKTTESEKPKGLKKPWHPCDNCVDLLADELAEWARESRPRHPYRPHHRMDAVYAIKDFEIARRWLEFYISPEFARAFEEQAKGPLDRLLKWQLRCQRGDWQSEDEMDDEYKGIQWQAYHAADYLRQLSVMLRAKINGATGDTRYTKTIARVREWVESQRDGRSGNLTIPARTALRAIETPLTAIHITGDARGFRRLREKLYAGIPEAKGWFTVEGRTTTFVPGRNL